METRRDRTTVPTEGGAGCNDHVNPANNDQVDPAKTDPGNPAKTTPRERRNSPPRETKGPRARSPTGLGSSSTSDHEAFRTAQAEAGATGSATPPRHRTLRSSSSSVDAGLLASLVRIKARFQRIDLHLGPSTKPRKRAFNRRGGCTGPLHRCVSTLNLPRHRRARSNLDRDEK